MAFWDFYLVFFLSKEFCKMRKGKRIVSAASERDRQAFLRSVGAWKGLMDADKLIRDIYADRAGRRGTSESRTIDRSRRIL